MNTTRFYTCLWILSMVGLLPWNLFSQCNQLRPQRDIQFNTDQDCAPSTVTNFTIRYFFNSPQVPADVVIHFEWNDPGGNFTDVDIFSGLVVAAGDMEFEGTGTFTYPANNDCSFLPTASIIIAGTPCPSSDEEQTVFSWARDNEFGGVLRVTPATFDVCFDNPVTNAIFQDNSTFNCNLTQEPDNPNQQARYVQFVYGTNHPAPANSVRDLTLFDGVMNVNLTDNTGALSTPTTINGVTGTYFGPIDMIPFPANGPISQTYPISAPANILNLVGNTLQVTMFNWNFCNPYNGNPASPNYAQAISTTAVIQIIDAPNPLFISEDNLGVPTRDFCLGETVFYNNMTTGGANQFDWEFFDDLAGTVLLGTSNANNSTFVYNNAGQKLVRLTATNNAAQSTCSEVFTDFVFITPTSIATIDPTDGLGMIIVPQICQDQALSNSLSVTFLDASPGVTVNTEWEWNFFAKNSTVIVDSTFIMQNPPNPGFYTEPGTYLVELITRDIITLCDTRDTVTVIVYQDPIADFGATTVCEGDDTDFTDNSILPIVVNGDAIDQWEWDFDNDGFPDRVDIASPGSFNQPLGNLVGPSVAGTYPITLTVTTANGICTHTMVQNVTVLPMPVATFTPNTDQQDCPDFTLNFENTSLGNHPPTVVIDRYEWYIDSDDGMGFVIDSIQGPADQFFTRIFVNNKTLPNDHDYEIFLKSVATNGCFLNSDTIEVKVFSGPPSGFTSDYNFSNPNCSPLLVNFQTDVETQNLLPDQYTWTVLDAMGTPIPPSPVIKNNPLAPDFNDFQFTFINNAAELQGFQVRLDVDKAGACVQSSQDVINVNPIPSPSFIVLNSVEECDRVTYTLQANQETGITNYSWSFIPVPDFPPIDNGREIIITYLRPLSTQPNLNLDLSLQTGGPSGCLSSVNTVVQIVENQEDNIAVSLDLVGANFGCIPFNPQFVNTTVGVPAGTSFQFLVRLGGNPFDTVAVTGDIMNSFSYEFDTEGAFETVLTAISPFGCVFNSSPPIGITTFSYPEANIQPSTTEGCAPLAVNFDNFSIGNTSSSSGWYVQELGQGSPVLFSNDLFTGRTFDNTGDTTKHFLVFYIAENAGGCTDADSTVITVHPEINASFSLASPGEDCGPLLQTFLLDQLQPGIQYVWDWGDGQLSDTTFDQATVDHLFENNNPFSSKNFMVTLTATDLTTSCQEEFFDVIRVFPGVVASVIADIDQGCAPLSVTFSNESLGASQHQWTYREKGEGTIQSKLSGEVVLITFPNLTTGTIVYEVVYTGTNSFGCQSSDTIDVAAYPEIDASFTVDPLRQSLPNSTITLANNSLNANSWDNLWTFGDGDSSQLVDPGTYEYKEYGEYLVRLVVSSENCSDQTEQIIVVDPILPIVEFTLDTTAGCRPLRVNFANLSQFADPESYFWDFGDGIGTSVAENPTYLYDVPGIYSVSLRAKNPIGLDVIKEKEFLIEVFDLPTADFLIRPDVVFLPDDPLFTSNRSRGAVTYLWDFGDEITSEEYEPQHFYQERGLYTITLTVTNEPGCTDTFSQENVVLVEKGGRIRIPNGFTPNPGGPSGGRVSSRSSGANDVFLPITEGVVEFQLLIFNRWGEVLFESVNRDIGWDGYFQDQLVQSDVYVYRLNLTFANGEKTSRVGDITLIR